MSLTDSEILELEALLKARERDRLIKSLTHLDDKTSPNYRILYESINSQVWGADETGRPKLLSGVVGCVLEGSSRSTKTWSGVFLIMYLALIRHKSDGCTINLYRETYNEFKTTLYDDFKRVLDIFGLPNKFHENDEVKSFKIGKTKIYFLGDGKHGGSCDYAFFNEVMMQKYSVFDQVEMRCRVFWWMDYNPSFTQHWVFDRILHRKDVAFLRTTFRDNPYIAPTELNKILGYEPWLPGSYEVTKEGDLYYNGREIDDHNQPPPHPENIDSGTADEFMWKVYGLGIRGAMRGQIFKNIKWIEKFPDIAFTYGMDLGFVQDPTTLVKFAKEGNNIYMELLLYKPISTAEELDAVLSAMGISKFVPITSDSSDRYVSERNGVVRIVRDMFELGWEISKVSKNKSVIYWIQKMLGCRIHVVKNHLWHHVKDEQRNYVYMEVNGIQINKPVEHGAHFFDGGRYAYMSWESDTMSAEYE